MGNAKATKKKQQNLQKKLASTNSVGEVDASVAGESQEFKPLTSSHHAIVGMTTIGGTAFFAPRTWSARGHAADMLMINFQLI